MSTLPNASSAAFTSWAAPARVPTSASTASARRPSARTSSATLWAFSRLTSPIATSAPSCARARTIPRPIPRPPPVTIALRPSRGFAMAVSLLAYGPVPSPCGRGDSGLPSAVVATAQHACRAVAGVVSVLDRRLAADEDVLHTGSLLDPAHAPPGQVVRRLLGGGVKRTQVEEGNIGDQARPQDTAVVEADA